jgi:hypothetical protein
VTLVVIALLGSALTGCFSGEGTPVTGPDKASCGDGYPPADVRQPAITCGVEPLHIPDDPHFTQMPRQAAAGTLQLDIYIEGDHTCGIGPGLCAVDDNRPFLPGGSPDPHADPTRNRARMVVDFAAQTLSVQISPSCRVHFTDIWPGGLNGSKECFAPNRIGEGTNFAVSAPQPGTLEVALDLLQTAYYAGPSRFGQVKNVFMFTPHHDGSIDFGGSGTNFPDLAIVRAGRVVCADQATHITAALGPQMGPDVRSYSCRISATVATHSRSQSQDSGSAQPSGTANGVTVMLTSVKRSSKNYYGEDLTSKGQFFVRMGVRVVNKGPQATEVNNLHFRLVDASHIVNETSQEGYGSGCGLSGNGDPGLTLAPGADVKMPESLCFEPHGSIRSPFTVVLGLDATGEVQVPVM